MALCVVSAIPIFGLGLQLLLLLLVNHLAYCEMSVYPGLRRKPSAQALQQQFDISPDFLAQLMEDNARRRLQQQFEQQLELINLQMNHHRQQQYGGPNPMQYDNQNEGVDFTYKFSPNNNDGTQNEERIPFAVDPSDPRFYEESPKMSEDDMFYEEADEEQPQQQQEQQQKQQPVKQVTQVETKPNNDVNYHRVKPPLDLTPMKPVQNSASNGRGRDDINALIDKLQKEGKAGAIVNSQIKGHDEHVVVRQHMGIEGDMGMYVVALIAGVSAAVTVGLIALGIAWYTLQKKTKAAADVEYPAYGVTGPNKDISPSGDRRLAQSAQMYHYQHQKQQIIAMENRQAAEGHGGLSDVESDDDNEEGDYTVYECPGLAPTGEMEVKNPLFLDDTPVTPITAGNQQTQNQQQQQTQSPQKQPSSRKSSKTSNQHQQQANTGATPTSNSSENPIIPSGDKKNDGK
ncbi:uncharacterized protein LOC129921112 isoform X2 [Episyrphus balteatus]|uniref:uncharacterized protein LOC129921112 isoform X2 n=1 Tax=Episyrphus balteatus TaxID=286459 RepID=UPI002485EC94|nr:uncharacterized protein LOC129921112 isoform X2 [Episyrphus balteatus]